jgi:hypothetical protein
MDPLNAFLLEEDEIPPLGPNSKWNPRQPLFRLFDRFSPGAPPLTTKGDDLTEKNIDFAKGAIEFLEKHLLLYLVPPFLEEDAYGGARGVTDFSIIHDLGGHESNAKIRINFSANALWPLLIPGYTKAQKAICSWDFATTLLHELGVIILTIPLRLSLY